MADESWTISFTKVCAVELNVSSRGPANLLHGVQLYVTVQHTRLLQFAYLTLG